MKRSEIKVGDQYHTKCAMCEKVIEGTFDEDMLKEYDDALRFNLANKYSEQELDFGAMVCGDCWECSGYGDWHSKQTALLDQNQE